MQQKGHFEKYNFFFSLSKEEEENRIEVRIECLYQMFNIFSFYRKYMSNGNEENYTSFIHLLTALPLVHKLLTKILLYAMK